MKRDFYDRHKSSPLMRFFWRVSGADRYILERSTYGDQIKYLCLGGIILATGVMAGLAGGYAFYTIFEPRGNAINSFETAKDIAGSYDELHIPTLIKSILFGIIWGLIIFNIDRFIVTSTGIGDGTEDITRKEFVGALPRIIMGAIIALTISKPVEIRMFKTEIDVALHEKQLKLRKDYETRLDSVYTERLKVVQVDLDKIDKERDDLIQQIKKATNELTDQLQGRGGANPGDGPLSAALKKIKDGLVTDLDQFDATNRSKREGLENAKKAILNEKGLERNSSDKVAAGLDGLLERIKIAHHISGFWISAFITLLFMAIELTPIFFKLMLIKGPYDFMSENIKELIKAENGIEVKANYYQDKEGHERDLVINHQVIHLLKEKIQLLEVQSKLKEEALRSWQDKKTEDVKQNPGEYINEEKTIK